MYRDYRIVVVTPAGRRKYLELLVPQILSFRPIVDEYHLWLNTDNPTDMDYISTLEGVTVKHLPHDVRLNGIFSIPAFYRYCTDPETIYVRFDDDVVLVDSLEAFKRFLDFRIDNPEYFLVMANILNNACQTHIHQRLGNIKGDLVHYNVTDTVGWENGSFAVSLHQQILDKLNGRNDLSSFRFDGRWILMYREEFSINCISWFGLDFDGHVESPEEPYLTMTWPTRTNTYNCVIWWILCSTLRLLQTAHPPSTRPTYLKNIDSY